MLIMGRRGNVTNRSWILGYKIKEKNCSSSQTHLFHGACVGKGADVKKKLLYDAFVSGSLSGL